MTHQILIRTDLLAIRSQNGIAGRHFRCLYEDIVPECILTGTENLLDTKYL